MFHFLHKIYVAGWIAVVLGAIIWLYPRSGISEPLAVGLELWRNHDGTPRRSLEHLSGTAIDVRDGASFTMAGTDRQLYSIGLIGLIVPTQSTAPKQKDTALGHDPVRRSKELLSELILSNEVEVALTSLDPRRRGLGIVRLGTTNINAAMVESGFVSLKRDYIKSLPLIEQYALLRADRAASLRSR
jgi:endonuclease YncB( thermonuclease family)